MKEYNFADPVNIIFLIVAILIIVWNFWIWNKGKIEQRRLIPKIWSAYGICGTFIVLALRFVDLDITNTQEVRQLPQELAVAFITSIIGIIMSQWTSFRISTDEDNILKGEKSPEHTKISPEEMLYRLMKSSESEQVKTNEYLRKISSSVGDNLGMMREDFDQSIKKLNQRLFASMQESDLKLKSNIKDMQQSLKNETQKVRDEFYKGIDKSINELRVGIGELVSYQKNSLEDINKSVINQNTTLINEQKQYRDMEFEISKQAIANQHKILIDSTKNMTEKSDLFLNKFGESMKDISSTGSASVKLMHEQFEILNNQIISWQKLTEDSVNKVAEQMKVSANAYEEQSNQQKELSSEFKELLKEVNLLKRGISFNIEQLENIKNINQ